MKAINCTFRLGMTLILFGCLSIVATARHGGYGGGGGGGMGGSGGHGMSGGGNMRSSSGGMRSNGGSYHSNFNSGQSSPRMASRTSDSGRSFSRGSNDNFQNGNRGNADRDRVNAFLNGNDRGNNGRNGDRQFDRSRNGGDRFANNRDDFRRNGDNIRRDFRDRDRDDLPFRSGWWDNRRWDRGFGPWAFGWWGNNPWYWWGWTTGPYLDSWLGYGWGRPYYWDYGPNGYISYQDNQFYENGQQPMSAQTYYQQVYDLAHSAPTGNQGETSKSDWMPLGVFAVTKPGQQQEDRMIQLAVSKDGVLSGTYYNKAKDGAHPILGMVDKQTHKAAWYFGDDTYGGLVFETSVDNLTEPQSTVMVHFDPGDVGVWQLVRIERPEATEYGQGDQGQTQPEHSLP